MAQSRALQSFLVDVDDSVLKNVLGTHRPDGAKIDLKPLLGLIDKILSRSNDIINVALIGKTDRNSLLSQTVPEGASADAVGSLAPVIQKISCELQCKCSGGDVHERTMVIMKMLEKYEWDAKAVIAIAAFSQIYGEFCLLAQLYLAHPLAKFVAILKNLPNMAEHGSTHRQLFGSVQALVTTIVDLAEVMNRFGNLNSKYLSEDKSPLPDALAMIHEPAYWVIFSVVVCTEQIAGISTGRTSHPVANLTLRVKQVLEITQKHLDSCLEFIARMEREVKFQILTNFMNNAPSQEQILERFFNWGISIFISCNGSKRDKKILHGKTVLILISGMNITPEEINVLSEFYNIQKGRETKQQAEIVWLPVIEYSGTTQETHLQKIKELRGSMSWFTIEHPSMIEKEVIYYIEKEWHFSGKTSMVAIDSSGKVSKNAHDMVWIWGDSIRDLSPNGETLLWENSTSVLQLIFGLVPSIDINKVTKGITTVVCFYGGKDIDWIKRFTTSAQKVADAAKFNIELVYVGKNNHLDKKIIKEIPRQRKKQIWNESTIWLFWTRLKSILQSSAKINLEIKTAVLQEIGALLTLDANVEKGWAVYFGGSTKLVKTEGEFAITVLGDMLSTSANWKDKGFVSGLDSLVGSHTRPWQDCNHFFVDHEIQEGVLCLCGHTMKKSYAYRCCHGNH